MAFFDDLGKKISQTGQGAVQKTKNVAETMKINNLISEEEKNVNNNLKQIGVVYFENFSENSDEMFSGYIENIKESKKKIEEYNEQINTIKGFGKCPNCGASVANDAAFCNGCGGALPKQSSPVEETVNTGKVCPNCGVNVATDDAFCNSCGKKIEFGVNPETVTSVEEGRKCVKCGASMGKDDVFCGECGYKEETGEES